MPNSQEGLQPAGVLLLQAEDGLCSTVKPQLQVAETDLDQIAVYYQNFFGKQPFLLPDDLSAVETAAAEVEAKLLIIGSINSSSPIPKFGEISPILPPKPLPSPVCRPLQRCNAGT
jgi:hypothetical protein